MQDRLEHRRWHPTAQALLRLELTGDPLQPPPFALYRKVLGTRQPPRGRGGRPAGRRVRVRRSCRRTRRSGSRGDPDEPSEPGERPRHEQHRQLGSVARGERGR
jgi:hypothetical protein